MDYEKTYLYAGNTLSSSFLYKKTGIDSPSNLIYFCHKWEESIYVPEFEYSYFKQYSRLKNVRNISEIHKGETDMNAAVVSWIKDRSQNIIIPSSAPLRLYESLIRAKIEAQVKDADFIKFNVIKDKGEIKIMKRNWNLAKDCFRFIEKLLESSRIGTKNKIYTDDTPLTSDKLRTRICSFLAEKWCVCEMPIIACWSKWFHAHFMKNHTLYAFEPIIIDLTFKDTFSWYFTDVTRTYCKWIPKNKEFIFLHEQISGMKKEFCSMMKPWMNIAQLNWLFEGRLHSLWIDIVLSKNYEKPLNHIWFQINHSIWHWIWRDMHELPVVNGKAHVELEKWMVIAIEPGAYKIKEWWIRLEDNYLITENWCINLTESKSKFIIK
ncbi:MAG: hypothetical protein ACD_2C00016G0005 [uncultured bacterium (gcode 4)]|uniref:Peptidase M24 domain-containing protein n=1 Tax=uncultured bacterium (gcode 4) TaxID=1234023 RepID=K2GII5_9BACT|nr:MAG: hypothetical protein ACD_2C00016G0005 [uncultured bacterium (gcode 4)]